MPEGALERAVELLGRIGEQPEELTVAELATDAGMPTSTAYRLLAELQQHGLVERRADRTRDACRHSRNIPATLRASDSSRR